MKVSELIEKIKDYPDFEVELTVLGRPTSNKNYNLETISITDVADIGYSSKIIALDGELKE